ncbi:MAG: non-homologous end-joining DNA ligase [Acidimicrobiales bacterium]
MAPSKLDPYKAKRDPARTPEPMGSSRPRRKKAAPPIFVVQEHHARALHWDFRLERDGVLVSWALPKGVPLNPKKNHLAVQTEDHPLDYGGFSGDIPSGEYGAGSVTIWDRGTYETEKWSEREVMVVLHGARVTGRYVLFKTDAKNWMIHRMDPAPDAWEELPELVRPMLCKAGDLPSSAKGWTTEFKWDGVRAVAYVDGGRVRLKSRNDLDITPAYPELHAMGRAIGSRPVILDGEIVAFDDANRPSFGLLQQRMHVRDGAAARRLAAKIPVSYLAFDVLHLDGVPTVDLPYAKRRELLELLELAGDHWATPGSYAGKPQAVLDTALANGLEGVVCKRTNSRYLPGKRTDEWVKVRGMRTQEVVVGGYTPGQGSRAGTVGALIVGIPGEGGLRYVGKVGTGFSDAHLKELGSRFAKLVRKTSPFVGDLPRAQVAGATWVRPTLVGEVRFSAWTDQGRLRQPAWRGLRPDKSPVEVRVEQ